MNPASNPALMRRLKLAGVGVVLLGVVWYAYASVYARPRASIVADIENTRDSARALQDILKGEKDVKARVKELAPTFLADKFDVLSARFRDGLTRVASGAGLSGVVVEHGQPQGVSSPLLNAKGMPVDLKRALRKTPDFEVVHGSLTGVGTLEQVWAAIASAQCQPWIHRVEGFDIQPVGKERDRFKVRVNVATVMAPAWAGPIPETVELAVSPTSPEARRLASRLSERNVFRKPPPVEATPVTAVARAGDAPAQPVAFAPYEDWKLTGVARGKDGPEAMFVNEKTNARVSVLKGGRLLDATLIDAADGRVLIDINGTRYELSSGQTLASRKPIGS